MIRIEITRIKGDENTKTINEVITSKILFIKLTKKSNYNNPNIILLKFYCLKQKIRLQKWIGSKLIKNSALLNFVQLHSEHSTRKRYFYVLMMSKSTQVSKKNDYLIKKGIRFDQ